MRWQQAWLIGLIMVLPTAALAADPGEAGLLFLRFGLGARASAMGEAYCAVGEDASSVFWNPGAMPAVLGTHLTLVHNEYFQSLRFEQAAITHETKWGTFGFMFTGLYMDDMDRYDDNGSSSPLGQFGAYDVAVGVAYGRYIVPNVSVGISIKPVYERIDELSVSALAFDAGIYHVSRIKGVKLAATVANLGTPVKTLRTRRTGHTPLQAGAEVPVDRRRVLFTFDAMFPNDDGCAVTSAASIRRWWRSAAYKIGYDSGRNLGSASSTTTIGLDTRSSASNSTGDSNRFGQFQF
jgi:hypothetical protein